MSYKHHEPVEEKRMLKKRYSEHHTICQQLRDIYQLAMKLEKSYGLSPLGALDSDIEEIKLKSRIAMSMAKSMHEKLKYYKEQFSQ